MIYETIISTVDAADQAHVAPFGIQKQGDLIVISPYRPSTTLDNILATKTAVMNLTDDVRVFAGAVARIHAHELTPATQVQGYRLLNTLSHQELTLVEVVDDVPNGAGQVFNYEVDWGDGSPSENYSGEAGLNVTHAFATAGTFNASFQATDAGGLLSTLATKSLTILASETQGNVLAFGGTIGDDAFVLTPSALLAGSLAITQNGVNLGSFTVPAGGVSAKVTLPVAAMVCAVCVSLVPVTRFASSSLARSSMWAARRWTATARSACPRSAPCSWPACRSRTSSPSCASR